MLVVKRRKIQSGVEYVEGDIRKEADLDKVCSGIENFHLAALPQ